MNDEIRIKIAELKGWKYSVVTNIPFQMSPPDGDGCKVQMCPNWPVNIQDAWELVEEMKQIGGAVCVEWTTETIDSPFSWWCGANVPQDYRKKPFTSKWHSGRADTAPLAICLAWIAWKESNK